jgi:hypothetical protein
MRKSALLILSVMMFVVSLYAGSVFMIYTAEPGTNSVSITWTTNSEDNISKFAIMRSVDDASFSEIGTMTAKGPGSTYTYVDENVIFKTSQTFFYKIEARNSGNGVVDITPQSLIVNPNISGIYRTWGAIKAMFR